jgi:fructokinase
MKSLAFGEILCDIIDGNAYIGGAPFNLAAHMSKMGMESFIISSLGKDKLGIEACEILDNVDIHKNYVSVLDSHPTGTVDVVLDEAGIPDYVINENTAWDNIELSKDAINKIFSEKWDIFCFGTLAQRTENNKNLLRNAS